ncbi:MAG: hypothetical protein E5W02_26550, partial [Mesorhizobium sp.]
NTIRLWSLANFGRQFKALKGLTPREYRGTFAKRGPSRNHSNLVPFSPRVKREKSDGCEMSDFHRR